MNKKLFDDLKSSDPDARCRVWRVVHHQMTVGQCELTQAQKLELVTCLWKEQDETARHLGTTCLLRVVLGNTGDLGGGESIGERASESTTMGDWLWEPFHQKSAVFRGCDPTRRRDEDAVIELARALPKRAFPHTDFVRIPLSRPDWERCLEFKPTAVCIVGRQGIFGDDAIAEFESEETRFYFPNQRRPADLPPGELSSEFHRIHQRNSQNQPLSSFVTTLDVTQKRRVDYGVVQRYFNRQKNRVVLILAGCSGLGTLGAVEWAANPRNLQMQGPENLDREDTLEILLQVEGVSTDVSWQWRTRTVEAIRILAGNREWYQDAQEWGIRQPDMLRIRRNSQGGACEVYGDSDAGPKFRDGSDMVKFVDAVYRMTGGIPGIVQPKQWGTLEGAWKEVAESATLRERLREKMRSSLYLDEKRQVVLNVPIRDMA